MGKAVKPSKVVRAQMEVLGMRPFLNGSVIGIEQD